MDITNVTNTIRIMNPARIAGYDTQPRTGEVAEPEAGSAGWDSDDPVLDGVLQAVRYSDIPVARKEQVASDIEARYASLDSGQQDAFVFSVYEMLQQFVPNNEVFKAAFEELGRMIDEMTSFESQNTALFQAIEDLYKEYNASA